MHSGRRPEIAMVLYNGMTLLDTIGPMTALNAATQVYLVAETKDPIIADTGNAILPTTTFDECPKDLDVLFVGGGSFLVLKDKTMLRFIADRGARAKYVTSVCSGSIVLGAAGLLKGYEATSHWASRDLLPLFGAKPVDARVVVDRNRMSGGGVTAGIDFGLTLLAKLVGEDVAKLSQLAMEYDPAPPFNSGSPKTADPEIVKRAKEWMGAMSVQHAQFVQEVSQAMPK
jgi:putative intracellular protease/amidase